jgi:hypothetical protein
MQFLFLVCVNKAHNEYGGEMSLILDLLEGCWLLFLIMSALEEGEQCL